MVTLDLSDDEHKLIMKLRKYDDSKSYKNKNKLKFRSNGLNKEFQRQMRNMKKIANLKFYNNNNIVSKSKLNSKSNSKFYKKIVKTETKNGELYEVKYEDVGDGKGLLEKNRKKIGNTNNINYRFSSMTNSFDSSKSYSKTIKTLTENGKVYKVIYEDVGDGKGMKEVSREFLGNANNKNILFEQFNTNDIEKKFLKKSKKRNNSSKRTGSHNYQSKTILENINGQAYLVTYENVNNEGFNEVNRKKI
jgi:hypothetical protein